MFITGMLNMPSFYNLTGILYSQNSFNATEVMTLWPFAIAQ